MKTVLYLIRLEMSYFVEPIVTVVTIPIDKETKSTYVNKEHRKRYFKSNLDKVIDLYERNEDIRFFGYKILTVNQEKINEYKDMLVKTVIERIDNDIICLSEKKELLIKNNI